MSEISKQRFWNNLIYILLLCCTLGLAPFVPEPHIWGKIKWIMGGGKGMQAIDFFDTLMHGFPWILLVRILIIKGCKFVTNQK